MYIHVRSALFCPKIKAGYSIVHKHYTIAYPAIFFITRYVLEDYLKLYHNKVYLTLVVIQAMRKDILAP